MIGHDVAEIVPYFRREAATLMVDYAVVTRGGGPPTFDPATGLLTPSAGTVVHEGACRLRQASAAESDALFGEQQVALSRFVVCFPHDTVGLKIDDVVRFTDCSLDAEMVGISFRIAMVPLMSFVIYKGYPCEVVSS